MQTQRQAHTLRWPSKKAWFSSCRLQRLQNMIQFSAMITTYRFRVVY